MSSLLVRCFRKIVSIKIEYCLQIRNHNSIKSNQNALRKTFYKNEEVKKFRSYILTRYMQYVQNYEKVIEKKFPTAMHLYRTFKIGMKEFYKDLVTYMKIIRKLNTTSDGLKSLSLSEIEIYHKMPKDMLKVAPVLLLSAVPLTNYIIFPLAYFYPRQLLCSHFWTIQQRSEFQVHYLRERLYYHRPTFRCLQAELDALKLQGHRLYSEWAEVLGLVGSGVQPTAEQIVGCRELFACAGQPYQLQQLRAGHVKCLLRMHGLRSLPPWSRRARLRRHGRLLRAMDRAVDREGLHALSHDALRAACFVRGLNPTNMRHEDMADWLAQWLAVSRALPDHDNLSLLLHCPILLGYNQPSNWLLIY